MRKMLKWSRFIFPSNQREQSEEIIPSSCDPTLTTYRLTLRPIRGRDGSGVCQHCCSNILTRCASSCLCVRKSVLSCQIYILVVARTES